VHLGDLNQGKIVDEGKADSPWAERSQCRRTHQGSRELTPYHESPGTGASGRWVVYECSRPHRCFAVPARRSNRSGHNGLYPAAAFETWPNSQVPDTDAETSLAINPESLFSMTARALRAHQSAHVGWVMHLRLLVHRKAMHSWNQVLAKKLSAQLRPIPNLVDAQPRQGTLPRLSKHSTITAGPLTSSMKAAQVAR